jgi:hypothetical protein
VSPGFCRVAAFELLAEDEVELVEPTEGERATIGTSAAGPASRIDLELDIGGHSFGARRSWVTEVGLVSDRARPRLRCWRRSSIRVALVAVVVVREVVARLLRFAWSLASGSESGACLVEGRAELRGVSGGAVQGACGVSEQTA